MEYLLPIFFFVGAIALAIRGHLNSRKVRWLRQLHALPRTRIDAAKPGVVKIVGRLKVPRPPLKAPFSGRVCAAYEVAAYDTEGDSETLLVEATRCLDFLVEDDTGMVLIRAADTALVLDVDKTFVSNSSKAPEPQVLAFLREHNIETKGFYFDKSFKCTEGVLEEGEAVVVCGHGRLEADPDPGKVAEYRELPQRFVIMGEPDSPMLISDDADLVVVGRKYR